MWQTLVPIVGGLLDKLIPDPSAASEAKLKALELAQKGELAYLDAEIRSALGQIEVNSKEADNANLFVSGWRPGAGWVCVAGLFYTFILQPILAWAAATRGVPAPPVIDTETLMVLLTGMLGLGGYRSLEKFRGVAR